VLLFYSLKCFFFFLCCSGYGVDITDSSTNVFEHYTKSSVTNCVSTSAGVKFYSSDKNLSLDCLLTGQCVTDYFYVSENGGDYNLCGEEQSSCETIVYF
jgi:hypothetical protein